MVSTSLPPTSKPRPNRVPSPPRRRPAEPVIINPFNDEDGFEDALEEPEDLALALDRETQLILSGGTMVKSYEGTARYTSSGASACGLAAFNAVKEVLELEASGTTGPDLVRWMLSRELVEQITSVCSEWSSPGHLEVEEIYQMSLFSRALELTSADKWPSPRDSLVTLFNTLHSRVARSNRSIAAILTKLPEIVAAFAIATHQRPPNPSVIFIVFDPRSRPQSHPNGTALTFFGRAEVAAQYLSELFAASQGSLEKSQPQSQAQLSSQVSSHIFAVRQDSEAEITRHELELELFRSNVASLETKTILRELTRQVADLSAANGRLAHDNDAWRKENQRLKLQLEEARSNLRNRPLDAKGNEKSNDWSDVTVHVSPIDDPSIRPRDSVVSSSTLFAPPPSFSESSSSVYPPQSQVDDDHLLAAKLFLEDQAAFGGAPTGLSDAELALRMQWEMDDEFASVKPPADPPSSSSQKTTQCRVCLQTHPEDTLSNLEGCDHQFCPGCMMAAVTAAVEADKFPVECPVCKTQKTTEGQVSEDVTPDQLRSQARVEGDAMVRCFRESQEAFKSGDRARAKELSLEGKQHQADMERLDTEAADRIFERNNRRRRPNEIDLHDLHVKEAIERTELAILAAQHRGETEIQLIVGRGLHSRDGVAKMRPAIEQLMFELRLVAEPDPYNVGVLVVKLNEGGQGMHLTETAKHLEND